MASFCQTLPFHSWVFSTWPAGAISRKVGKREALNFSTESWHHHGRATTVNVKRSRVAMENHCVKNIYGKTHELYGKLYPWVFTCKSWYIGKSTINIYKSALSIGKSPLFMGKHTRNQHVQQSLRLLVLPMAHHGHHGAPMERSLPRLWVSLEEAAQRCFLHLGLPAKTGCHFGIFVWISCPDRFPC